MTVSYQDWPALTSGELWVERPSFWSWGEAASILKRRSLTIVLLWIVFSGLGTAAWFVLWQYYPDYEAISFIACESPYPPIADEVIPRKLHDETVSRFITTQALAVKSEDVLQRALTRPRLKSTVWYESTPLNEQLTRLQEELVAVPVPDTNFVRVSIICRQIDDPHRIVSTVVDSYLEITYERAKREYRDRLNESVQEEEAIIKQLLATRDKMRVMVRDLGPGVASDSNATGMRLHGLAGRLAEATSRLESLRAMRDLYLVPGLVEPTSAELLQIELDPLVDQLTRQLVQIDQQRRTLDVKYGRNHKDVVMLEVRRAQVAKSLDLVKGARLRVIHANARQKANFLFEKAHDRVVQLREQYDELTAAQDAQDRRVVQYKELQGEMDVLKDKYVRLFGFNYNLGRMIDREELLDIYVAQPANKPLTRSGPLPETWLPIIYMVCLGLATAVTLWRDNANTSVRTTLDISRHVGMPQLGTVPHIDDEEVSIERVETAVKDAPNSMLVEAFRTIRTNLMFSSPAERQRTLLITSPHAGDGKTTVATNLALVIAQGGRRVLLVDANFRKPSLHSIFPAAKNGGLSHLLVGRMTAADLDGLVLPTGIPNLEYLPTGPIPPNPAELLGNSYMREFLDKVVFHYDVVLLDGPPMLVVTDAIVLSSVVDATILVLRAESNSRGVACRARAQLERVNARVFGTVLNAAHARRGGYFREQFRLFYDYHENGDGPHSHRALPKQDT